MQLQRTYSAADIRSDGELSFRHCGWEACEPGHTYGPAVRDHFLIHYVLDGHGGFRTGGGGVQRLSKGDGFLIRPSEVTWYGADREEPWTYCWIGFDGTRASALLAMAGLAEASTFRHDRDDFLWQCIRNLLDSARGTAGGEVASLGHLYLFLSRLVEDHGASTPSPRAMSEEYALRAVQYIQRGYGMRISVEGIAAHLGIDRTHLFRVFRRHLGTSPQDYLLEFRLHKACELLRRTTLSIGEVACSVGFEQPAHFSAQFRRRRGVSPRDFRRRPEGD